MLFNISVASAKVLNLVVTLMVIDFHTAAARSRRVEGSKRRWIDLHGAQHEAHGAPQGKGGDLDLGESRSRESRGNDGGAGRAPGPTSESV